MRSQLTLSCLLLVFFGIAWVPAAADTLANVAGDGKPGLRDGAAATAEFLLPAALAAGSAGSFVIADAGAQRIRQLRDGIVTTLAGSGGVNESGLWVDGGYLDGIATSARFSGPSGVVMRPNRDIVIADTYNHCIRLLHSGVVSTIAGAPTELGDKDGDGRDARFEFPRQMAIDSAGNIYVADLGVGIRKITPDNTVSTLTTTFSKIVTSVSIEERNDGKQYLLVATVDGISRINLSDGTDFSYAANPPVHDAVMETQGGVSAGYPYSVAAVGDNDAVITDLRTNSVRYLHDIDMPYVQYLLATPLADAPRAIFPEAGPRLLGPMSVLVLDDGSLLVASGGDRRIVRIGDFETKRGITFGDLSELSYDPNVYRIALVGDSYTWHSTLFVDSVAGRLQARLNRDNVLRNVHKRVKVVYFSKYVTNYVDILATGIVDFVISDVNAGNMDDFSKNPLGSTADDGKWQEGLHASLLHDIVTLHVGHVGVLVCVNPFPWEISPAEGMYRAQNVESFTYTPPGFYLHSDYFSAERNFEKALANLPAPVLNLWPVFRDYEKRASRLPLYNTDDWHYSPEGRLVMANALADKLEALRPWDHTQ